MISNRDIVVANLLDTVQAFIDSPTLENQQHVEAAMLKLQTELISHYLKARSV